MAYIINGFDGRVITSVEDGTVDQTLDIKLVGKNYAGYGEIQNESFVHMLENFASSAPPPNAIPGQLWYDSINKKIKFHYAVGAGGIKLWKSTGGAEYGSEPNSPTTGDLWFDSLASQLKIRTESAGWLIVGPQTAGSGITQLVSRTVKGKLTPSATAQDFSIIVALINNEPIYVISRQAFTLDVDNLDSVITGFTAIKQGITLAFTSSTGISGETTDHVYWGTASSARGLVDANGNLFEVDDFITTVTPDFTQRVDFADAGLRLGNDNDFLIYVDNASSLIVKPVVIENVTEESLISIKTTDPVGNRITLMNFDFVRAEPGITNAYDLGAPSKLWRNIYATTFTGIATQANTLRVGSDYRTATTAATDSGFPGAPTIAVRDGSGNLTAAEFKGTADRAVELKVGSVFRTASLTAEADTVAVRNGSGNLVANVFIGNVTGNLTGSVTGNASSATLASTVSLTATNSTNDVHYLSFTAAAVGAQALRTDTGLTYNPSTNTVTATNFIGNATTATTATNLAAGVLGSIPYQTGVATTGFVPIGTNGFVLTSTGSAPTWTSVSALSGGSAANIEVTNTPTDVGPFNITFTSGTSGSQVLRVDSSTLNYSPSTNTLTTGNLILNGNLTVNGTSTTINATSLEVADLNITVARNATSPAAANGAGLTVAGATATMIYNSTTDTWNFNKTIVGTLSGTATSISGQANSATITATSVNTGNQIILRDSGGNFSAGVFTGTATQARYADLAEKYLTDVAYSEGTVVVVGGTAEVTASSQGQRAIGVVSTNPAYMMNSELVGGTYIALKGRVPVKVSGSVNKGDQLMAGNDGTAIVGNDNVFAVALETNTNSDVKLVECVIL
jgi:hypothetical protein